MRSIPCIALLALLSTACGGRAPAGGTSGTREAWNAANDPANLRDRYEIRLEALPLKAELAKKPWSDTYWPNYLGGLASRWSDPDQPSAFTYASPALSELRSMSESDLSHLSPAEKYDAYRGRYDYPFVASERARTSPDDPRWFGLCHGWAPAAYNFDEPRAVTLAGANGIRIPFGSSDVKALLLFAQQDAPEWHMAGERCEDDEGTNGACRDVNAGSFHVILANQIGLLGAGFVAEVSRGAEIWNQPVYGFSTRILSRSDTVYAGAAPGTRAIVEVETTLDYIAESEPSWEPLPFSMYPEQGRSRTYRYALELDAQGGILGGEWRSTDHPDFFWTQGLPALRGMWAPLRKIYAAAHG